MTGVPLTRRAIGPMAVAILVIGGCDRGPDDTPPCGGSCPEGRECVDDVCRGPNLTIVEAALADSIRIERRIFADETCEVRTGCATSGARTLLRFDVPLLNSGPTDLLLGDPENNDLFEPSACFPHAVIPDLVRWRLVDENDTTAAEGSFGVTCVNDGAPFSSGSGRSKFDCVRQGLQSGWMIHLSDQPCGFADVSGLGAGRYALEVTVNAKGLIDEESLDDNAVRVEVHLPVPTCTGVDCGGQCCPYGAECIDDVCLLPDLVVSGSRILSSLELEVRDFAEGACHVVSGCVEGTGERRLLRFDTTIHNQGPGDLVLGDPEESPLVTWSECRARLIFPAYASHRLIDAHGDVVARGSKEAFCYRDEEPTSPTTPATPRFDCSYQGLSAGWFDTYASRFGCQWVDITDVPSGQYLLEVEANPARLLPEADYENNRSRVAVTIPPPAIHAALFRPAGTSSEDGRMCDRSVDVSSGGIFTEPVDTWSPPGLGTSCGGMGGERLFHLFLEEEELVYLSTYGSTVDTVLALRSGGCPGEEVACTDKACDTEQSHLVRLLPAGEHHIVVRARRPEEAGTIQLKVIRSGCARAFPLAGPGRYAGSTDGGAQLWHLATCPGGSPTRLSTCGMSSMETVLDLRDGRCEGPSLVSSVGRADACPGAAVSTTLKGSGEGDGLWFVRVGGRGAYELLLER